MRRQLDLFTEESPEDDQPQDIPATSLKLTLQTDQLSPEQQRFNKLLERIDKLKKQQVTLVQLCDAHRPVYLQKMAPLRQQHQELMRAMVLWLDNRLQRKGLTAVHKRIAAMILCEFSMQLAAQGDEAMEAMHDKHSHETLEQREKDAVDGMREAMEEMLGEPLSDDEPLETVEDILKAGMERMREAEAAEQEAQRARKCQKKPGAAQLQAQAEQADAESTLRKVFRQLASALHPDRESDPAEHARKTALMSEANAAYERRDLIALLQIQLRTELTNIASIAKMAEEKIAPLTLLLKQQTQDLENELQTLRHKARREFGLDHYETVNAYNLHRKLMLNATSFKKDLAVMQRDLQQINDDKFFKQWLKYQEQSIADALAGNTFFD